MIDVKLLGPKGDQYAPLSDNGAWLATTKAEFADEVKAAIEAQMAPHANRSHQDLKIEEPGAL